MPEFSNKKSLDVIHISKSVGTGDNQFTILTDVNFNVKYSETVALVGESGSGKSTLLSLLAGLDNTTTGDIFLLEQNLMRMDQEQRAKLRIQDVGFVFQSFMLIPTLSALENVQLPALLRGESEKKSKDVALALLAQLGLEKRLFHLPKQLSGGEQQRVALARAFSAKPKILFADEPTGNLDRKTGENIIQLMFSLNQNYHTTLFLVTHDLSLAKQCHRQLTLVDGQIHEGIAA